MTDTTEAENKLFHEAITLMAKRGLLWKDLLVDVIGKNGKERWEVRCTKREDKT